MLVKDVIAKKKINATFKVEIVKRLRVIMTADISDRDFVIDHVAEFAKHQAIEKAMIASVDALGKRDFETIQKLMSAASLVGASDEGLSYDYFGEIENRTQERIDLAAGTIDLVAESGLKPHDYNALVPVVRGAGGMVGNWSGGADLSEGQLLAAATPELVDQAVALLS